MQAYCHPLFGNSVSASGTRVVGEAAGGGRSAGGVGPNRHRHVYCLFSPVCNRCKPFIFHASCMATGSSSSWAGWEAPWRQVGSRVLVFLAFITGPTSIINKEQQKQ